jgi:hypothetical protein
VYLFGIRLSYKGQPYPDAMFTHLIEAAEGFAGRVLGIPIGGAEYATVTNERHDDDITGDQLYILRKGPIREVTNLELKYGTKLFSDIPASWATVLDEKAGHVQLIPIEGSIAFQQLTAVRNFAPRRLHGTWSFTYTAGYKADDAPAELKQLVALIAANVVLITAGDLILGAGIASSATSLDGISRSINTTSSATNSGYGARIIENRKVIKDLTDTLRGTETGPIYMVI